MSCFHCFSSFCRYIAYLFLLSFCCVLVAPLFQQNVANADVGWIAVARECEEFETGLNRFWKQIGPISSISPEQKEEVRVVVKAACGPRFSHCEFSICQGRKISSETTTAAPEAKPLAANQDSSEEVVAKSDDEGHRPEKPRVYTAVETSNDGDQKKSELTPGSGPAIVTDPLAWLDRQIECDEVVDQMAARYTVFGSRANLPDAKKQELSKVEQIVCGDRFKKCAFKFCDDGKSAAEDNFAQGVKTGATNESGSGESVVNLDRYSSKELQNKQVGEFTTLMQKRIADRKDLIAAKKAAEEKQNLRWVMFKMPADESTEDSDEDDSQSGSSPSRRRPPTYDSRKPMTRSDFARRRSLQKQSGSQSSSDFWPVPRKPSVSTD